MVFIGSNDTFLQPGSLDAALKFANGRRHAVLHLHAFNFFLLHKSSIVDVGWFDETSTLPTKKIKTIPIAVIWHESSACCNPRLLRDMWDLLQYTRPRLFQSISMTSTRMQAINVSKWGGDSVRRFHRPYNDAHTITIMASGARTLNAHS